VNRTEIISVLKEMPSEGSAQYQKALQVAATFPAEYQRMGLIHALAEPLTKVLSTSQPEFADGRGFMVHQPNSAYRFAASEAAVELVERVMAGENPEAALDWLERVLLTQRASGLSIMALLGVAADQRIDLGRGIEIVPLTDLPQSPERDSLLTPGRLARLHLGPWAVIKPPRVALAVKGTVEPFLTKQGEPHTPTDPFRYHNLLEDARLALSCIGPCAPLQAGSWFQYDDPDLQAAAAHGGIATTLHEIGPAWFAPEVMISTTDARELVSGFLALSGTPRARLRVSLQRLNQSLRRLLAGDKAMELSIALEALLAEGIGENTYKVGLRAALVAGGDHQQRVQNRAIVSAVYALRSAVVHKGLAPDAVKVKGRGRVASTTVVGEAAVVTATVIRRVISGGKLPDWYDLELQK